MITQLTEKQCSAFKGYVEKWVGIGLSTKRVERGEVQAAIKKVFATIGKPAPRFTIILRSPQEVCCAIATLSRAQIHAQVHDQVSAQVRAQVSAQVRAQVRDQVHAQVHDQVSAQVRDQVSAQVCDQVRAQVCDQVRDQVHDQVSAQVRDQVSVIINSLWYDLGQFSASWLSFYDFCCTELKINGTQLEGLSDLSKCAGWSVLFWDWVFVSDRPKCIHRDDKNLLHCEDGPAVMFTDDFAVWAIHGVRVPRYVIMEPSTITVKDIEAEKNTEVRRIKIERYGLSKYLIDSKATQIHQDDFGTLYRKDIPGDEPLLMVKVVNSTVEPDGSFKDYFLRVPPTMLRAKEAVAWTFHKSEDEYCPDIQT